MVSVFNEILGHGVDLPEHPRRIISFSPALTESLFLLGLGENVVGVSAFCARPPEASEKRKVGSYNTVRPEVLAELRPDLILTVTGYQRDFAIRMAERFPVYPLELPVSVAGIIDTVVKLGLVLGISDRARAVATSLARKLTDFRPLSKKLRVYVEIDLGGPVTFGAYSYITDAISFFGCSNIYGGVRSEWLAPDFGEIAKVDPDIMLFEAKMFSKFENDDLERLIDGRGWRDLTSIANRNYYLTPGPLDLLAHHGPSFVTDAIPWLKQKLTNALQESTQPM
jgi:ABC-type Fe3+-hydroxamate transport system substrate-binding protein